jgi:tripartite-type tricarboxylate transporter receptor subunit TctC
MKRTTIVAMVGMVAGTSLFFAPADARAQAYPSRAVTIVVPFPPGISLDGVARLLGSRLSDRLGRPFVIENRPGAAGVMGAAAVAKAAPDGYTLLMGGSGNLAIHAKLSKALPYDPAKDFVPVALAAYAPFVLVVSPALPVNSVQELVALAKERPGKLSYASPGPGTPPHLSAELFKHATGVDIVHVPYRGSPQALIDLAGGQIEMMFADMQAALPLLAAGKVRALGVSSRNRVDLAPQIAPIAEAGVPGFEAVAWLMLVAPANTPSAIVGRLHAEAKSVLALPESREWIVKNGLSPAADMRTPEQLNAFVREEISRWGTVLERIGMAGTQ